MVIMIHLAVGFYPVCSIIKYIFSPLVPSLNPNSIIVFNTATIFHEIFWCMWLKNQKSRHAYKQSQNVLRFLSLSVVFLCHK